MSKKVLKPLEVCRLCMRSRIFKRSIDIFGNDYNYADVIQDYARIKISLNDGLPQTLCDKCAKKVKVLKNFVLKCINVDRKLRNVPDDKIEEVFIVSEVKQEIKIENYIEPEIILVKRTQPPPLVKINYSQIEKKEIEFSEIENDEKISDDEEDDEKPSDDDSDIEIDIQNDTQNVIEMKKDPIKKRTEYIKNELKAPCDTCGKSYKPTEMKYHLNKHLGIFPYVCSALGCDKSFTTPALLKGHKLIHSNDRNFKCDECGATFKRTQSLKHHKSYHGDPQIPCTVCSSKVRNKRALRKHMMTHTGERPYPCTVCPKAFANNYNLQVHLRIHTGEKPFFCEKCGDAFGYNSLLKAHTEKYHPVN